MQRQPHRIWLAAVVALFVAGAACSSGTGAPAQQPSKPGAQSSGAPAASGGAAPAVANSMAVQAWHLASISQEKYRHLRLAYMSALSFVVFWGIARLSLSLASV